ncbi:MAG TPA: hypothetical protein VHW24_10270 [Bryobacteraceae bacterium]|jgi:hypothetical protein|nr:hypothetical protein [Bryobacteraceae bacterium]
MVTLDKRGRYQASRAFWALLFLILLGILATVLWRIAAGTYPGTNPEPIEVTKVSNSNAPTGSQLSVALLPPVNRVYRNKPLKILLLFMNNGKDVISIEHFSLAGCLTAAGWKAIAIQPHDSTEVHLNINASRCKYGKVPLQMSVAWRCQDGKCIPGREFLASSPILVTSVRRETARKALRIAFALLHDLTWPLVLALLGYLFQATMAKRGERSQILNVLLPEYAGMVQMHYLPIARRIQTVLEQAKKLEQAKAPVDSRGLEVRTKRIIGSILLLRRVTLALVLKKGGIYFRSRLAENLYFACYSPFRKKFEECMGEDLADKYALKLKVNDTLEQAMDRVFPIGPLDQTHADAEKRTTDWIADSNGLSADFKEHRNLLRLCLAVLSFECDRPFYQTDEKGTVNKTAWYFDAPVLEFTQEMYDIPVGLRNEIVTQIRKYLDGLPRECKRDVKRPRA